MRRPGGPRAVRPGVPGLLGARRRRRRTEPEPDADDGHARRRRDEDDATATIRDAAPPNDDPSLELRFSITEVLRHKDFADYDDVELAEAHRLMTRMRLTGSPRRCPAAVADARTARRGPTCAAPSRAAMRTEGEPIRQLFRAPATRHRRLVLLLDVSGSMEPYARALLRFVQAAVAGRRRVEAFALGTRLTRITRELGVARPRRGAAQRGRAGRRLVGRHPPRRRAASLQRGVGRARAWPAARSS